MKKSNVELTLTRVEAEHILFLLINEKNCREYCGNQQQYYNRTNRIMKQLEERIEHHDKRTNIDFERQCP